MEAVKMFPSVEDFDSEDEIVQLIQTLKKDRNGDGDLLCQYGGFWLRARVLRSIIRFQKHFKAQHTDIILSSMPKCGTTWLKALTFSIANRHIYSSVNQTPLLASNPHQLIPFLEFEIYAKHENPDLENIPSPRLFSTHMPYQLLPNSIPDSNCRIIYICRNPLDHFISHREFVEKEIGNYVKLVSLDEAFEKICRGIHPLGPFCDHVGGYWDAHLKNPRKVLFLKYEDLKEDIVFHVKKIAEFIGSPFSLEEEQRGRIEEIAGLCSFENLTNLEVNKTGKSFNIGNSSYFRKGQVGDWANYLAPVMAEKLEKLVEDKLGGTGLKFKYSRKDIIAAE